MDKAIVAIDSTKLNVLQLCGRKYNWVFKQALSPLSKPDYLERGDLMHKMLAPYYIMRRSRSRWAQNKRAHEDVIRAALKIGEHFAIQMQLHPDDVQETMFQFTEYCRFYEHDGWDRIIAVEQPGSLVLYEDNEICIVYELKPDLIIQLDNIAVLPVDHKTAKQRKEPSRLANQFIGYCYALKTNNIVINKIGFQKTLKPAERFQRHTLSYPDDVLEEWKNDTVWWVKQLLRYVDEDYWPPNFTSCDKWGGCVFEHVCVKERIAREYELMKSFERSETWDVGRGL